MSKPKVGIDENGWVRTGPALNISGVNIAEKKEFDGELPAEPRDPNNHATAVHWNGGDPELRDTGNNISPNPTTAYDKINSYFIDKEGSTDSGLDRVDSLMSNYPTADRAISNEAYNIAKNRIDKAQNDGEITSTEASDLKDILDGAD